MMRHDFSLSLSQEDQHLVATWVLKTAMVLEGVRREEDWFYTDSERAAIADGAIPPGTAVWIGRHEHRNLSFNQGSRMSTASGAVTTGSVATLAFGFFVAQVLTVRLHPDVDPETPRLFLHYQAGPWDAMLRMVWPTKRGAVRWPQARSFGPGAISLERLAERFVVDPR
jgi:hypothetical protein